MIDFSVEESFLSATQESLLKNDNIFNSQSDSETGSGSASGFLSPEMSQCILAPYNFSFT